MPNLRKQPAIHNRQHTHTQNSPATSKVSYHTSRLCAREVGITNHPPLRVKLVLKTTKKFIYIVHNSTQFHNQHSSTHRKVTTKRLVVESFARSWDLWDRPIILPLRHSDRRNHLPFRHIVHPEFLIRTSYAHPLVATPSGIRFINSSPQSTLQLRLGDIQ